MPRKETRRLEQEVMRPGSTLDDYVTIADAAQELGLSQRNVRERLRRRGVPVTKVGYFSLIRRVDLEKLA